MYKKISYIRYKMTQHIVFPLLALTLFIGGIVLLALNIGLWKLIVGLPAVILGTVFIVYSFDFWGQNPFTKKQTFQVNCSICNRPTLSLKENSQEICPECEEKLVKKNKK